MAAKIRRTSRPHCTPSRCACAAHKRSGAKPRGASPTPRVTVRTIDGKCYLRVAFPSPPTAYVRAQLKAEGFRFFPAGIGWSRTATVKARAFIAAKGW